MRNRFSVVAGALLAGTVLAGTALIASTQASSAQSLFALFDTQPRAELQPQFDEPNAIENDAIGNEDAELPANLQRRIVRYDTREAPGTLIVDTPNTYLYYVLGNGQAIRYGIGVGREGFAWSGVKAVERKAEWPDWRPPAEMIARQPYLPRMTAGGPGNPLGARALYIGGTLYRIHGTNDPATIGRRVSSGCIRLTNEDVIDLYSRVRIGSKVIVLPASVQARHRRGPAAIVAAGTTPQDVSSQDVSSQDASSYAPPPEPSRAARTWAIIGDGLY